MLTYDTSFEKKRAAIRRPTMYWCSILRRSLRQTPFACQGLHRLFCCSSGSGVEAASLAMWGYSKENGPSTWVKNLGLKIGNKQSPIDIIPSQAAFDSSLKNLKFSYPDFKDASLLNNGLTVQFAPNEAGNTSSVSEGAVAHKYKLAQFHFHWGEDDSSGSEHTVDGNAYAGELHLVHWNTDLYKDAKEALTSPNGLTVLGIFLKVGSSEHPGLKKVTDNFKQIEGCGSKMSLKETFNPTCLFPDSLEYWSYPGSLTTPPLAESVTWVVFKNPIIVSSAQIAAFREMESAHEGKICKNYRPTCPLHGRKVKASFE